MGFLLALIPSKAKIYAMLGVLLAVLTAGIYGKGRRDAKAKQRAQEAEDYAKDRTKIDKSVGGVGDDPAGWLRDRADKRGLRRPDSGTD